MFEQRLEAMYQKVMDLEKFAETKNSILLTFIGVILVMLFNVFGAEFFFSLNVIFAIPVFIALIMVVVSFLPYMDCIVDKNKGKMDYDGRGNIFDVKVLSSIKYDDAVLKSILNDRCHMTEDPYQKDLFNAILFNARITKRKFFWFRYGISTLFVIPLPFVIFYDLSHHR